MAKNIKRVAVFTSRGDAPGMNAALRAVVRTAVHKDLTVFGIQNGYEGMIEGVFKKMDARDVANIMQRGGTILKSARSMEFMTEEGRNKAFQQLQKNRIDACIALGGNGTFTGAEIFSKEYSIPFIGVPCTIDNDLYGTDNTIGFDTAVNTAVEAVDNIRDTAESHDRLFFIEVMGRHSGFIALHCAIASGAGLVLLPEKKMTMDELVSRLEASAERRKLFNLVIVAEGNHLGGVSEITTAVQQRLPAFDVRMTVIGHLQRGGSPSGFDRLLASRLGNAAVEALLDGIENAMVGIINHQVKHTPLNYAIKNEKELNLDLMRLAEMLAL
jgi:6-phosphofructokinase 1